MRLAGGIDDFGNPETHYDCLAVSAADADVRWLDVPVDHRGQ